MPPEKEYFKSEKKKLRLNYIFEVFVIINKNDQFIYLLIWCFTPFSAIFFFFDCGQPFSGRNRAVPANTHDHPHPLSSDLPTWGKKYNREGKKIFAEFLSLLLKRENAHPFINKNKVIQHRQVLLVSIVDGVDVFPLSDIAMKTSSCSHTFIYSFKCNTSLR